MRYLLKSLISEYQPSRALNGITLKSAFLPFFAVKPKADDDTQTVRIENKQQRFYSTGGSRWLACHGGGFSNPDACKKGNVAYHIRYFRHKGKARYWNQNTLSLLSASLMFKSGFSHKMKDFWYIQFLDSSHSCISKFQTMRAKMARISA